MNFAWPTRWNISEKNLRIIYKRGMTLLEIIAVVAIIAILAVIAIPAYSNYSYKLQVNTAIADIKGLEVKINTFYADYLRFPAGISELNVAGLKDPWGNPYQYIPIAGIPLTGPDKVKCRKDGSDHPLNSDYDLYSMGRDRDSKLPLTAKASQDDIIRTDDGKYVGLVNKSTKTH